MIKGLSESEREKRITKCGPKDWELIRNHVTLETDRILLPWFSNWLRWNDEPWTYTIGKARSVFWDSLPSAQQMWELLIFCQEKRIFVDHVFDLLWMWSWGGSYYLLENEKRSRLEKLLWSPSTPFSLETDWAFWENLYKVWKERVNGLFQVRLQWDKK